MISSTQPSEPILTQNAGLPRVRKSGVWFCPPLRVGAQMECQGLSWIVVWIVMDSIRIVWIISRYYPIIGAPGNLGFSNLRLASTKRTFWSKMCVLSRPHARPPSMASPLPKGKIVDSSWFSHIRPSRLAKTLKNPPGY